MPCYNADKKVIFIFLKSHIGETTMDKLRRAFYILAVLAFIFLCSIIIIEFYNLGFIVAYIALYLPAGMTAVGIV